MAHPHTVHLPLGALHSPCAMCGAGGYTYYHIWQVRLGVPISTLRALHATLSTATAQQAPSEFATARLERLLARAAALSDPAATDGVELTKQMEECHRLGFVTDEVGRELSSRADATLAAAERAVLVRDTASASLVALACASTAVDIEPLRPLLAEVAAAGLPGLAGLHADLRSRPRAAHGALPHRAPSTRCTAELLPSPRAMCDTGRGSRRGLMTPATRGSAATRPPSKL